ncbi:hypothetical protein EZJ19_08265 [Parasulfuritortus cantonensis]|uniref:Sel1 repeat family protein n=2 Tax=Parasulfuritortus cantonensis TaxID=2528202 RepID=A0A4R1BDB5_9PROT|nr:hypothetical protein EZJ19_08265 [Parasulfuritortus cantonensis]
MRRAALLSLLALAACAGSPPPPDWKMNAQSGLEGFQKHYLDGNARLADLSFAKARAEAARTGRPDLVARIELARCGVRAAALEFDDCPGYQALAEGAAPAERSYAAFLSGAWQGLDAKTLPTQYAPVLKAGGEAKLAEVADPVSRLIAAGVLFKAGRLPPAGIVDAVETASGQGWRRPLLAWLGVELQRARAAGDGDAAARIQRRIDLVATSVKP